MLPVYPCVYREHAKSKPCTLNHCGLSLCIQGTQKNHTDGAINPRFIPVYTGNTGRDAGVSRAAPVYPCVYREHCWLPKFIFFNCGLSLCIQGTLCIIVYLHLIKRFIPVYTGNTSFKNSAPSFEAVYPCVYREHSRSESTGHADDGLSLCIQGTLDQQQRWL